MASWPDTRLLSGYADKNFAKTPVTMVPTSARQIYLGRLCDMPREVLFEKVNNN